jgi:hypothetical protein
MLRTPSCPDESESIEREPTEEQGEVLERDIRISSDADPAPPSADASADASAALADTPEIDAEAEAIVADVLSEPEPTSFSVPAPGESIAFIGPQPSTTGFASADDPEVFEVYKPSEYVGVVGDFDFEKKRTYTSSPPVHEDFNSRVKKLLDTKQFVDYIQNTKEPAEIIMALINRISDLEEATRLVSLSISDVRSSTDMLNVAVDHELRSLRTDMQKWNISRKNVTDELAIGRTFREAVAPSVGIEPHPKPDMGFAGMSLGRWGNGGGRNGGRGYRSKRQNDWSQ